jgi:transglutaminase superfamily protein
MGKRLALAAIAAAALSAAAGTGAVYVAYLPLKRRLPKEGRTTVDGVTTIAGAVDACRRAGLSGWDLAAYAQNLAARKFSYSRLNTWDSPARAFERGMGYCEQQARALKRIYDALGIASRPVMAMRCRFPPEMIDGMPWAGGVTPHAWLRVRIDGEERDVCPGSPANRPGVTHFQALSRVRSLRRWMLPWTHLGSAIANIRRDTVARRRLPHDRPLASLTPSHAQAYTARA